MSPEAQRIAIAEACGVQTVYWKVRYNNHGREDCHIAHTREDADDWPFNDYGIEEFVHLGRIPDYLTDLNAMHEAEKHAYKVQPAVWASLYHEALRRAAERSHDALEYNYTFHANASQRAKAFLKALNLWKEDAQ